MGTSITTTLMVAVFAPLILASPAFSAPGEARAAPDWRLPRGTSIKEAGPQTYRFTVDMFNADGKGETLSRQRLTGEYTRGLADGKVEWNNVAQADSPGATGVFLEPQKRDFMSAFRYVNRLTDTMKPEFFAGFPPMAVSERNLVWDTGMIEYFGQQFFDHLELNLPFHVAGARDIDMPGIGTFQNRDIVLEWIGRSRRNGRNCAVISYQAFLNPLRIALEGLNLQGRSEYWGQIWVAIDSKQIEYATLHETVVGELLLGGQSQAQVINVFRTGALERVGASK